VLRSRKELLGRLRSRFTRTQTWQQADKYVSALVNQMPKRNGWTIAQQVGDRTPDCTQRLLNRAAETPRPRHPLAQLAPPAPSPITLVPPT
jgi:hypothetical protein